MSALSVAVGRRFVRTLTSPALREAGRVGHDWRRRLSGREAVVHYFHQPGDPYSALAAGLLPALRTRYRIRLETHAVPPPDAAAAPDALRLAAWAAFDAVWLAQRLGMSPRIALPEGLATDAAALRRGGALRAKLGHYQGAMFSFEGEWYWGVDRLHYLESRLQALGLAREAAAPLAPPPPLRWETPVPGTGRPQLDFFCSLRSPYTWLAVPRVRRLAAHYGAELRLRMVLPMVMRGLPVPWPKRRYILLDAKREAERLGLPFGDVADPVGAPVERGLALVHHAEQQGRGIEVAESFLRGVFAEGIDAGSDRGLARIATRAGLDAADVRSALADTGWRGIAEANRDEMLAQGLWGVPSFRVEGCAAVWGQDRLWMVEDDLIAHAKTQEGET
jgi:2-hydroxychromene-2-carboxylate isomerase